MTTTPTHFLSPEPFDRDFLESLLDRAQRMKHGVPKRLLEGRSLGLLFFNRSLRTRASFQVAMFQLGGQCVNLTSSSDFWDLEPEEGKVMDGTAPEHVKDAAKVLSGYLDALAIRTVPFGRNYELDRRDAVVHAWAKQATVPVINLESNLQHPCQAVADLMTLRESLGELRGQKVTIAWTANPQPQSFGVVNSLLLAGAKFGIEFTVAHPEGYDLDAQVLSAAKREAEKAGASVKVVHDLTEGCRGAKAVYARSWASIESYGQPSVESVKRSRNTSWIVDAARMRATAGGEGRFLHAMPVRRNVNVTDEVIDGPHSLVYLQAANRLHSQKAILATILKG
ncbi:MAG TPA: N-acetylornithine carbamoyltransferase [Planctomycetota bacterium]|nr:N-acetylornithine carbamoyltransferase [Planctomycetota bacterium]